MWQKIDNLVHKSQSQKLSEQLESLRKKYNYNKEDNYYRFLHYCVQEFQPAIAIEIGVDFGVGSKHMVEAAKEYGGLIIGVDIHEKPNCEIQELKESDFYHFINYSSTSENVRRQLSSFIKFYGPIGLVFQDSSHHYLPSKAEWEMISPMCRAGTIWICDDITPAFYDPEIDPKDKGMCQYFEEIPRKHKRIYQDVLHYGNAQGIVIL